MSGTSSQDYYLILGILPGASQAEVTTAYHLLAREHHPDLRRNDESIARLKLINEAYEVLSDQEKRRAYDRQRAGFRPRRSGASSDFAAVWTEPGCQTGFASYPDPGVVRSRGRQDPEVAVQLPITPEEARAGGACDFTLNLPQTCSRCAGLGRSPNGLCAECDGRGTRYERHRLQIVLPPGLHTGTVLRVAGPAHLQGGLLLRIKIQPYW